MIIGGSKQIVIENIKHSVLEKNFNAKVEPNDVNLNSKESQQYVDKYWKYKSTRRAQFCNYFTRWFANSISWILNTQTKYTGLDRLKEIKTGAILTSNHFNPLENTAIRRAIRKTSHKHLYIISQETNLVSKGPIRFLFWNYDILPIISRSKNFEYMGREFPKHLEKVLSQNEIIMIYPEQEMWFNYRKPRPPKRGAYYYSARFNVPIISCFVEIIDRHIPDNNEFNKTGYKVHVLKTIYPDPNKTIKENSIYMQKKDYSQKIEAYEKIYHRPLTYEWESEDIIGWNRPKTEIRLSKSITSKTQTGYK